MQNDTIQKLYTEAEYKNLPYEDKIDLIRIWKYKTFGGNYQNITEQCPTIERFKEVYPNCPLRTAWVLNRYFIKDMNIYKADKMVLTCHDEKLLPILLTTLNEFNN